MASYCDTREAAWNRWFMSFSSFLTYFNDFPKFALVDIDADAFEKCLSIANLLSASCCTSIENVPGWPSARRLKMLLFIYWSRFYCISGFSLPWLLCFSCCGSSVVLATSEPPTWWCKDCAKSWWIIAGFCCWSPEPIAYYYYGFRCPVLLTWRNAALLLESTELNQPDDLTFGDV